MEASAMIVLMEVYLSSWSRCLFIINFLFLRESSSHKYCLPLGTCFVLQVHLEDTTILLSILVTLSQTSFWYSSIILLGDRHILVFRIQPWRLEPTLLLVKSRSIRKLSIMSYYVELRDLLYGTPPEAEHHLPSLFCTGVTSSILWYYVSMSWTFLKSSSYTHMWACCLL